MLGQLGVNVNLGPFNLVVKNAAFSFANNVSLIARMSPRQRVAGSRSLLVAPARALHTVRACAASRLFTAQDTETTLGGFWCSMHAVGAHLLLIVS